MPDPARHPRSSLLYERNQNMGVQRNVHISLRRRYIYVGSPKVANSTIKGILQQQELRGLNFEVKDLHNRLESPLIAPFQLTPAHFETLLTDPNFFRFAFVRNPYTRLLSCYLDRVRAVRSVPRRQIADRLNQPVEDEISFAAFVDVVANMKALEMNEHFRPQWALVSVDAVDYDLLGRFESFDTDLHRVLQHIWPKRAARIATDLNLSPKKTSADELLGEYYSAELATRVATAYADDFRIFGYDPEQI